MAILNTAVLVVPMLAGLLLATAAAHDLALRTIPNTVPLALLALGVVLRVQDGGILLGGALAFVVFAGAFFCWRRGWMGGGDVKLLGATALVVPPFEVGSFLLVTTQCGGLLALLYLVLSRTMRLPAPDGTARRTRSRHALVRVLQAERWRICRGAPLPYGFAIAVGGITLLLK